MGSDTVLEPTFDRDGYPTEETLKIIAEWDCVGKDNQINLLKYVQKCWRYDNFFTVEEGTVDMYHTNVLRYNISTGGWSGNESLISALEENHLFWALCWVQSRRGGHYIFHVTV
jgi:hypothetical protein